MQIYSHPMGEILGDASPCKCQHLSEWAVLLMGHMMTQGICLCLLLPVIHHKLCTDLPVDENITTS